MEFLFFIFLLFIVFGLLGGENRKKTKSRLRQMEQASDTRDIGGAGDYPSSWRNYEATEANVNDGMQDDLDPSALFEVSKARLERAGRSARKAAAAKIAYESLPKPSNMSSKTRKMETSITIDTKQPPLIRDMNLSRRRFLSGGRGHVFGERQKSGGGGKSLLSFIVLGLIVGGITYALQTLF
jgi:hypothetical protein